jgi:hypothetical protein
VPTTTCATAIPSFHRPHVTDYQQIALFIIPIPLECDLYELIAAWEELGSGRPLRFPRNESCTTWANLQAHRLHNAHHQKILLQLSVLYSQLYSLLLGLLASHACSLGPLQLPHPLALLKS